jgi:hypothetical protein
VFDTARYRPPQWVTDADNPHLLILNGAHRADGPVRIPSPGGRLAVWVEGSFGRAVTIAVDQQPVGTLEDRPNGRGEVERVGTVQLSPGAHFVSVYTGPGTLKPGSGADTRRLGPIYFAHDDDGPAPVVTIAPSRWRSLCGRYVDWVEVVRP